MYGIVIQLGVALYIIVEVLVLHGRFMVRFGPRLVLLAIVLVVLCRDERTGLHLLLLRGGKFANQPGFTAPAAYWHFSRTLDVHSYHL